MEPDEPAYRVVLDTPQETDRLGRFVGLRCRSLVAFSCPTDGSVPVVLWTTPLTPSTSSNPAVAETPAPPEESSAQQESEEDTRQPQSGGEMFAESSLAWDAWMAARLNGGSLVAGLAVILEVKPTAAQAKAIALLTAALASPRYNPAWDEPMDLGEPIVVQGYEAAPIDLAPGAAPGESTVERLWRATASAPTSPPVTAETSPPTPSEPTTTPSAECSLPSISDIITLVENLRLAIRCLEGPLGAAKRDIQDLWVQTELWKRSSEFTTPGAEAPPLAGANDT